MSYQAELAYADLAAKLNSIGQSHVFRFWAFLTPDQQADFARQLNSLDWNLIHSLAATIVKTPAKFQLSANVEPAPYYPHTPTDPATKQKYAQAFQRGINLIRQGKVAAFCVAGGQGTRLGWNAPKGTFPATAIKKKPLFQLFAEYLRTLAARYPQNPQNRTRSVSEGHGGEGGIPFYIMTSPQNDAATRTFWQQHHHFGLNPSDLFFFPQDQMPAFAPDGKVLLESKSSLALSPNGHGGSLLALHNSGALADMKRRGITQISYFQVDNPLVRCIDPLFLGLHDLDGADMSSKMLPKVAPKEKLGNFALIDGKMSVIEYSDLPDELAEQRLENGDLRFRAGSIAIHAIRVDFVESLNKPWHGRPAHDGPQAVPEHRRDADATENNFALPFHRAEKKVPCIDLDTGAPIDPEQPNAIKLETFVFDALPLTKKSIIYETDRLDEFAPIKNPTGTDSAQSAIHITTQRNARWLESAGIQIPRNEDGTPNCTIEISPTFALYPADISAKKSQIPPIHPGDPLYLE